MTEEQLQIAERSQAILSQPISITTEQYTQNIERIIADLELVKIRPGMYIGWTAKYPNGRDGVDALVAWLSGFWSACYVLGYTRSNDINRAVLAKHGYERKATGVWERMRERGMPPEDIIQNVLQIEIDEWKMRLEQIRSSEGMQS